MNHYIFFVTAPNSEEGKKIAKILVENKIAACVNIISNIYSIYRWKGKIEETTEVLLVIKTIEEHNESLVEKVKEVHSYDTPECVGFKIDTGFKKYLDWIINAVE
jgi:periplasmic divalent cation tolerance protein